MRKKALCKKKEIEEQRISERNEGDVICRNHTVESSTSRMKVKGERLKGR